MKARSETRANVHSGRMKYTDFLHALSDQHNGINNKLQLNAKTLMQLSLFWSFMLTERRIQTSNVNGLTFISCSLLNVTAAP